MKKYVIKAQTIMYVHVGAGEENEIDPLGYVIKEDESGKPVFYRINLNHLMKIDPAWAQEFIKAIEDEKSIGRLRNFLKERFNPQEKETWFHRAAVSKRVYETYEKKIKDLKPSNQLIIRCMPSINGRVYIPGSSIKGAMRTAFLDWRAKKYDKNNRGYQVLNQVVANKLQKESKTKESKAKIVEEELLNYKKIEDDPFKSIKVEDVFLPPDSTEIIEVMNVREKKEPLSLDMFVEAVKPDVKFNINIGYEDTIAVNSDNLKKINLTIEDLLKACGEYFLYAIDEEQKKHYPEYSPADYKVQDALIFMYDENNKLKPDHYLLRVGRFSHLESMTYNHRGEGCLCEPHHKNKKDWGKSRNLVDGKYPLGVIGLVYP